MRLSWQFFSLQFWLKFLVGLTGTALGLTVLQVALAPHQNLALKFDGQIGDFYADKIIADPAFTNTNTFVATPNCMLVPSMAGSLSCVKDTGSVRWQTILTDPLSTTPIFVPTHKTLLATLSGGGLLMLTEKTGDIVWQYKHQQEFEWKQTLVSDDEKFIVLLNNRNQVFVFETDTGTLVWKTPEDTTTPVEPKTRLSVKNNQVYVTNSAAYTLTSFDIETGKQVWQQKNYTGDVAAHLEFAGDLVWYETNFYTWQGASPATGEIKAKATPPPGSSVKNLSTSLVFHNYGNQLFWFNAQTGTSLGITALSGKIQMVWFDKQLFVKLAAAPFAENLTVIDVSQRTKIWNSESLQIIKDFLILNENMLVVSSLNGQLTWLNRATGEIIATIKAQETPLVLVKHPSSSTGFWLITTHHGTYSTHKTLTDVWFFSAPAELVTHYSDLPVVGAARHAQGDRLWLINQSQNLVIGLTKKTLQQDVRFWTRPAVVIPRQFRTLQNIWGKIKTAQKPTKAQLSLSTVVTKNFQGCLVTTTIIPNDTDFKEKFHQSGINPWHDVQATTSLKRGDQTVVSINGFYFLPDRWRTILVTPNLAAAETLMLETTLSGAWGTLSEKTTVEIPASCAENFITLSADKKSLQTPTQQFFWGMGLQDGMMDSDGSGSVFDDFQFGLTAEPDFTKDLVRHDFKTHLKTFREGGFSIFRISQDNFSFKNWQSFQQKTFRASLYTGLITDEFLKQLKAENYRVVFGIFGFQPETESSAVANYLDYCIARFGAWVDVWELSNEAWPDEKWVTFASDYLKKNDPYHHLITTNWDRSNLENIDVVNLHYYRSEPAEELTAEFLNQIFSHRFREKPILFGEFGNSGTNWDPDSAERLRLKSWLSAWQRTPLIIWNQSGSKAQQAENSNLYMGPMEREVTKNLVGWLGKYEGIPLQPFSLTSTSGNFCSGLSDVKSLVLIYCTNSSGVSRTELFDPTVVFSAAGITTNQKWKISWTDPKTLEQKSNETLLTDFTQKITAPPFTPDLVSVWQLAQ